jgi:hypothetical protein
MSTGQQPMMSTSRPLIDSDADPSQLTEAYMTARDSTFLTRPASPTPNPRCATRVAPAKTASHAVGQLVDETPDAMTLHTQDAVPDVHRPRRRSGEHGAGDSGGRRFAAVLKAIWYLSANDNPYADWILIRVYQSSVHHPRADGPGHRRCARPSSSGCAAEGLACPCSRSRSPATVELGFRSPYGVRHGRGDRRVRLPRADGQDPRAQGPS